MEKRIKISEETKVIEKFAYKYFCDCCGGQIKEVPYEISSVQISFEEGSSYPSGTDTETEQVDCCVKCFKEKVKPALENLGFKFRRTVTNY